MKSVGTFQKESLNISLPANVQQDFILNNEFVFECISEDHEFVFLFTNPSKHQWDLYRLKFPDINVDMEMHTTSKIKDTYILFLDPSHEEAKYLVLFDKKKASLWDLSKVFAEHVDESHILCANGTFSNLSDDYLYLSISTKKGVFLYRLEFDWENQEFINKVLLKEIPEFTETFHDVAVNDDYIYGSVFKGAQYEWRNNWYRSSIHVVNYLKQKLGDVVFRKLVKRQQLKYAWELNEVRPGAGELFILDRKTNEYKIIQHTESTTAHITQFDDGFYVSYHNLWGWHQEAEEYKIGRFSDNAAIAMYSKDGTFIKQFKHPHGYRFTSFVVLDEYVVVGGHPNNIFILDRELNLLNELNLWNTDFDDKRSIQGNIHREIAKEDYFIGFFCSDNAKYLFAGGRKSLNIIDLGTGETIQRISINDMSLAALHISRL